MEQVPATVVEASSVNSFKIGMMWNHKLLLTSTTTTSYKLVQNENLFVTWALITILRLVNEADLIESWYFWLLNLDLR